MVDDTSHNGNGYSVLFSTQLLVHNSLPIKVFALLLVPVSAFTLLNFWCSLIYFYFVFWSSEKVSDVESVMQSERRSASCQERYRPTCSHPVLSSFMTIPGLSGKRGHLHLFSSLTGRQCPSASKGAGREAPKRCDRPVQQILGKASPFQHA